MAGRVASCDRVLTGWRAVTVCWQCGELRKCGWQCVSCESVLYLYFYYIITSIAIVALHLTAPQSVLHYTSLDRTVFHSSEVRMSFY